MKLFRLLFLSLLAVSLSACSNSNPGVDRYGAYCAMLNPLVAKATREQVLRRFGMPSRKEEVADVEVWQYLKNYGAATAAGASASQVSANTAMASAVGITLGIYDDVTIIFDKD